MNIGLFLSRADGLISQTVDVNMLAKEYAGLPTVKIYDNFVRSADTASILKEIHDHSLNAVVLAGESPFYFQRTRNGSYLIQKIIEEGINPNHVGFVNLREQIALPHKKDRKGATKKAKFLIDVAIEKVRLSHDIQVLDATPRHAAAIFGSTVEGLMAAQRILEEGYKVYIIDRREQFRALGQYHDQLLPTLSFVESHPQAHLFLNATVVDFYGHAGDFYIELASDGKTRLINVGVAVAAVGQDVEYTSELHPFLRIDLADDGFFRSVNQDTMLVDTAQPGIFLISASEEKGLAEEVLKADSAALAAVSLLSKSELHHQVTITAVDENLCGGCGTCIKTCIFHAATLDAQKKLSGVDVKRCVGCGNCVTACPAGARDLSTYPTDYLFAAIDILSKFDWPTKVLYLACEGCGYRSLDVVGAKGGEYSPGVLPLMVRCGARIDTQLILSALTKGFDGVVICKCRDGQCNNLVGNTDLDRRANLFREILRGHQINPERLQIFGVSCEGDCVGTMVEFFDTLKREN